MPRRGHRKSRAGCVDCKRRHVKCDETRPACVNCKVAALKCSYLDTLAPTPANSRSSVATPAYSPLTPDVSSSIDIVRNDARSNSVVVPDPVNFDHLELLHHYDTLTFRSFTSNEGMAFKFRMTALSNAFRFPFLMYSILALSAMHLCRTRSERAEHYRNLASSLQAVGLQGLKDNLMNISEENCVAMFIFSTTTGLHSFCDTFTFREPNFNDFLDKLTGCIKLMQGVRSVMDGGWWDYLRTTDLKELLESGNALGSRTVDTTAETRPLWELLDEADISLSSRHTYEDTVTQLQRVFKSETQTEHDEGSVSMVFAWPVIISAEYNSLLIQRRPEALVILAFYGVVLHNRRDSWAVGDAGQYLVRSICDYLGNHWERWLVWPKQVISSAPTSLTMNTPG